MAKERECLVDGRHYQYCPHCNKNGAVETWKNTYCSKKCRDIFNTCSKYEGGLIAQEEAYNILSSLDINIDKMQKSVRDSVEKIMSYKPVQKPRKRKKKQDEE